MRIAVMTAAAIALLTVPTQAQMNPGQPPPWQTLPKMDNKSAPPEEHPATKADDKAYKSALDKIPPKQAHDPWGNVREKPQSNNSR